MRGYPFLYRVYSVPREHCFYPVASTAVTSHPPEWDGKIQPQTCSSPWRTCAVVFGRPSSLRVCRTRARARSDPPGTGTEVLDRMPGDGARDRRWLPALRLRGRAEQAMGSPDSAGAEEKKLPIDLPSGWRKTVGIPRVALLAVVTVETPRNR